MSKSFASDLIEFAITGININESMMDNTISPVPHAVYRKPLYSDFNKTSSKTTITRMSITFIEISLAYIGHVGHVAAVNQYSTARQLFHSIYG